MKRRVLFLCTGNSARSQIAEGLLRHMAGDKYEVFSAGTHPREIHPLTVEVMKEAGVDISSHTSKDVAQFVGQPFDYAITVCNRARELCPIFRGALTLQWDFADPTSVKSKETQLRAFKNVRDEIQDRLRQFVLANKD